MIRKIFLIFFSFVLCAKFCFADEPATVWKCAVYPVTKDRSILKYARIEFRGDRAVLYTYFKLPPITAGFSPFAIPYKFFGKSKNNPNVFVFMSDENESILAVDTVRHVAAEAGTLLGMMPSDINEREHILYGKKIRTSEVQKTGASAAGYYCNVNQNIKFPDEVS